MLRVKKRKNDDNNKAFKKYPYKLELKKEKYFTKMHIFFQNSLASHSRASADRLGRFELRLAELRAVLGQPEVPPAPVAFPSSSSSTTFNIGGGVESGAAKPSSVG